MAKTLRPSFYSGQNVYRDNLQNIVEYDSEQRRSIITKLYHDGVINPTPYDLGALRVMSDAYRNNAKFTDFNSSLRANNPIQFVYNVDSPPNPRIVYAQKFQARSNNIQKVRLWALLDVQPGIVWGTMFVEIRPLVGHSCTSTNSCSCQSVIADDLSDLYTEPSSEILGRVVIDHNLLNDSFPYLDVNFATEPMVSNIDGRTKIVPGKYYSIVVGREYSAINSALSFHGSYGNNMTGLNSFVTRFDPTSGLWIDQTGDSMAYQVFSNTVEILAGDGYVDGKLVENPFMIENTSGSLVDFHLGNIDLVHMKSVAAAGYADAGGEGRNMVLVRITTTPADYQPNPRTGNPSAVAEAEVIETLVVTEKSWRALAQSEKDSWLILAYVTDENVKTVKGLYEPPCDINSGVISGNWSPGLIKIEDVRKFLPHAQVMKYGEYDGIPARDASTSYNTNLSIETVQADQVLAPMYAKDPLTGPYNIFKTFCNPRTEMTVFDSSFGVILTTPGTGKYMCYLDDSGNWQKVNIVPPMLSSVVASADPTSLPRAMSASTTIGGCINANMGLRVRLNWTPPTTGCHLECAADGSFAQVQDRPYRGIVIVRSTEDFPRSIDDGTIIAASEAGFVTSDGRTYSFDPVGQVNQCCASSTVPGIIGLTTALTYDLPMFPLEISNTTEGGVLNQDTGIVEFSVVPGVFPISIVIQNVSGRVLRPIITVSLIHSVSGAIVGSYELYDDLAPIPVIYDTHGAFAMTIPVVIPSSFSLGAGTIESPLISYDLPTGPMVLDIAIRDSIENEQIGHSIMNIRNDAVAVPKIVTSSYLLTRVDANDSEQGIDASYISDTDTSIGLSGIAFMNYSDIYLENLFVEVYAVANQIDNGRKYIPTDAVKLPLRTRSNVGTGWEFIPADPAILLSGVNSSLTGVEILAEKDLRIMLSDFLVGMLVGDVSVPSPFTVYVVLKHSAGEADQNLCVTTIPLFIVKRADATDGSECTCYVDSYTGTASSTVFSGCSPELATNACFNGLSYNQVYYYTLFTYNDAGHFSYIDRCNQVVYGMFNSIPPGPICQFQAVPQYTSVTCFDLTMEKIDRIRLQWLNPSDPHLYGFRVYVSEFGHASNFVEYNTVPASEYQYDVCDVSHLTPSGGNMMLVYDTFLTPWITASASDLSRTPGETSYLYDGLDNSPVDGENNTYRVLYELAEDGRSLLSEIGIRRDLRPGVTYFYTIFTYDVYGNFNAPSCIDRGAIVV